MNTHIVRPSPERTSGHTAVGVIGRGGLATALCRLLSDGDVDGCVLSRQVDSTTGSDQDALMLSESDVVVEVSSAEAAAHWLPIVTSAGKTIVVASCGVFAEYSAKDGPAPHGKVIVPTGAVGALDVCAAATRAARRSSATSPTVRLTTTKRPEALGVDRGAAARTVFEGSAREAVARYPRTSNVAAALSIATVGFDSVIVGVVADPDATGTTHSITFRSDIGDYDCTVRNRTMPGSDGRTSEITIWSIVTVLENLDLHHGAGLLWTGTRDFAEVSKE